MLSAQLSTLLQPDRLPRRIAPAVTSTVAAAGCTPCPAKRKFSEQIQLAVATAVAEVEARQAKKTTQLVADLEQRDAEIRRSLGTDRVTKTRCDRKRLQVNKVAMMRSPRRREKRNETRTGLLLLALAPAWAQIAKPAASTTPTGRRQAATHSRRPDIGELEQSFDGRLVTHGRRQ